jgi:hypothetical protein
MKSCNYLLLSLLLCIAIPGIISITLADDGFPQTSTWNPYEGWDLDLVSRVGVGLFPTVEVSWTPAPSSSDVPSKISNPDFWVKLSYYPRGSSDGEPALLSGYVGGRNYNTQVTIAGKTVAGDDFHNIITIRPQDNGVFAWAVPDKLKDVLYYQATATVGGTDVKSEIVKTTDVTAYTPASVPAITSSTSSSKTSTKTSTATVPVITTLTLSSDTLSPSVGSEVQLSGRLTDSNGKGVSGEKISIEAPDWGTDFLPLTSAITESDGGYTATIKTHEDGIVQVRAIYEGSDSYLSSTSNTLTFSTMPK